jgi:hypothetical protein
MRILFVIIALALCCGSVTAQLPPPPPLAPLGIIPLDGVRGRIDHLAVDVTGQRLFAACYGNNTVEVVDLRTGQWIHTVPGLREPQGVVYIPNRDEIIVSCGGDGTCRVYSGRDYDSLRSFDFKKDADNLRLDSIAQKVYVGFDDGALGIIDLQNFRVDRAAEIRLSAHPEAFQLLGSDPRIFVNLPESRQIAVVNRRSGMVDRVWPLVTGIDAEDNFPMALDEKHHWLIVGCRQPPRIVIRNYDTGELVANLPCRGDVDDVFYDSPVDRIYAVCGEGFVVVYEPTERQEFRIIAEIPTSSGARTGIFVPEWGYLYVAAPARDQYPARIFHFGTPR